MDSPAGVLRVGACGPQAWLMGASRNTPPASSPGAERALDARDAYASVTALLILLLTLGLTQLLLIRALPPLPFVVLTAVSAVALLCRVWTRRQPRVRAALAFSVVTFAATLLLIIPWLTWSWCRLGRPWEAFTVPQLALVSLALVVPRFRWLGFVLVGLLAAEIVGISIYVRSLGVGALLSLVEPYQSLTFAVVGIGLLLLRAQRRTLTLKYLQVRAEMDALQRVSPLFTAVREQLDGQLAAISTALHQAHAEEKPSGSLARIDRTLSRMASLSGRLERLDAQPLPLPPEAERQFFAREAQLGAAILAAMAVASAVIVEIGGRIVAAQGMNVRAVPLVWAGIAVLNLGVLGRLFYTRHRPSERRALWLVLVPVAFFLAANIYCEVALPTLEHPYTPFVGQKLFMASIAIVMARRFWLALALVAFTAASAVALYFLIPLTAHRDIVPLADPWAVLVFFGIGVALLLMREQRQLARVGLLRAEWQLSALLRRANMYFALRDLLNTPLQVLVMGLAELEQRYPSGDFAPIHAGVDRLVAVSRQLHVLEAWIAGGAPPPTLDSEHELSPLPAAAGETQIFLNHPEAR